jgi:hypothetical protein
LNPLMLSLISQHQSHLARLSRNVLSLEKAHPHTYRHRVTGIWLATTKRGYHLSRRRHHLRWVPFVIASATGSSASAGKSMSNQNHTLCSNTSAQRGSTSTRRRRRYLPPPVGISAREFSSSSSSSINADTATSPATTASTGGENNDDDLPTSYSDDCPLCAKYSAGPCGTLFRRWLACTDNAAAAKKTNTNGSGGDDDRDHVALCAQDFDRLQACLEEHSDYYDKIRVGGDSQEEGTGDDDDDDAGATSSSRTAGSSVQQAWESMIQEELAGAATESFPEALRPIVRIRPKTGQATASFAVSSLSSKGVDNFVLAFVRTISKENDTAANNDEEDNDADAYTLLAAGAKEDLYIDDDGDDRIVLAFRVPADSATVIVSAVYEKQDDSVAVYEYRVNDAVDAADERS